MKASLAVAIGTSRVPSPASGHQVARRGRSRIGIRAGPACPAAMEGASPSQLRNASRPSCASCGWYEVRTPASSDPRDPEQAPRTERASRPSSCVLATASFLTRPLASGTRRTIHTKLGRHSCPHCCAVGGHEQNYGNGQSDCSSDRKIPRRNPAANERGCRINAPEPAYCRG